jgi:hypothetical protein
MRSRSVYLVLAAVLGVGCAGSRMPETGFGALKRAVTSYYEGHATEENCTCLSP